jgi:hypothetical protein
MTATREKELTEQMNLLAGREVDWGTDYEATLEVFRARGHDLKNTSKWALKALEDKDELARLLLEFRQVYMSPGEGASVAADKRLSAMMHAQKEQEAIRRMGQLGVTAHIGEQDDYAQKLILWTNLLRTIEGGLLQSGFRPRSYRPMHNDPKVCEAEKALRDAVQRVWDLTALWG